MRSTILAALRSAVATRAIDAVYTTARDEIERETREAAQSMLDRYQAGIEILAVSLLYDHPPDEIHDAFRGRSPHPLAELNQNLARRADRAAARTNYVEALGLVEYLVERNGLAAVACFTRDLGEGRTVAEALRVEFGLTPDELYRNWREWARV